MAQNQLGRSSPTGRTHPDRGAFLTPPDVGQDRFVDQLFPTWRFIAGSCVAGVPEAIAVDRVFA